MIKWLLFLIGGGALFIIALFCVFAFMVWNFERGFPKSILAQDLKGACVISKKSFVLVKNNREYLGAKVFDFLPKPEGRTFIYSDYIPGTITKEDGSEAYDLQETIEVPAGARLILKDGFQNRTMNGSQYYFWLALEGVELDSNFFYTPLGITIDKEDNDNVHFFSEDEMTRFPDTMLFEKPCDTE